MIKVLEKNVADKIAAGEVVEGPISVIKELVENSIDAGASSIIVEIKKGGKSYMRVTDNGCGIPKDQVKTAFLRHATSKISDAADLMSIETLGFRGEALASIAAVSRLQLVTKDTTSAIGTELILHGGEVVSEMGTGCPDGTTMIVSDLFFNTPAREKFLKADSTESGKIINFMSQIALAFPDIRFSLINNGETVFSTTGKGDRLQAILAVYKQREFASLVSVTHEEPGLKIEGYISKPSLTRPTRKNQIFFVNGRDIDSKVMERGLMDGYSERLFDGRYPIAFLFLTTDPSRLDVNIHPNKREVRFDDESLIRNAISEAVKTALGTKQAVTEVTDIFRMKDIPDRKLENQETIAINDYKTAETADDHDNSPKQDQYSAPIPEQRQVEKEKSKEVNIKQLLSTKRQEEASRLSDQVKPEISIDAASHAPFDFSGLNVTGSIFGTYITAVDSGNFYLIDQHAAHERIFYEKLVGAYLSENKLSQPILTPITFDVPLELADNEYSWTDSLGDMGFVIEPFGGNTYIIREIPTFMDLSEAEDFAKTFANSVDENTKLNNTIVISKLITKSCKSAVKAHDHLSTAECEALIKELSACRNPFSCPHGRPTFVKLSEYEIEKLFKRV
jgi:DNA mismatch repair protein MutL